jgi:hypothetical protein
MVGRWWGSGGEMAIAESIRESVRQKSKSSSVRQKNGKA